MEKAAPTKRVRRKKAMAWLVARACVRACARAGHPLACRAQLGEREREREGKRRRMGGCGGLRVLNK